MTDQANDTTHQHPSGLPLSHWLTVTEALIAAQVAQSLEEHGLTRAQWQVLNVLSTAPRTTAELTGGFEEEQRTAVAGQLEELVESGWVVYEGELYSLTQTGRSAGDRVAAAVTALRERATEGLPAEHYDVTLRTLRQVARNLGHPEA